MERWATSGSRGYWPARTSRYTKSTSKEAKRITSPNLRALKTIRGYVAPRPPCMRQQSQAPPLLARRSDQAFQPLNPRPAKVRPVHVVPFRCRLRVQSPVVVDAPLRPRNALGYLITKHPETMSSVSTVLITVGGMACLPGFANCVAGTILAHPAVTFAGGIAFSVGNWLKAVVNSATADGDTRAQPENQAAV